MKVLKITSLILVSCLLLVSCAISFRDQADTTRPIPTDPISESSDAIESTETTTALITETLTTPDTESDTSSETTAEETTVETTEAVTTPAVVPDVPQAGTYKPKALMYHLILDEVYGPYENLFVRPAEFEIHLSVLDELGYEYLFAEEWRLTAGPSVIITLDDGYEDNYTEMFPLLKAYGAKATVFLVTDLIGTDGYMTRDMIREMSESGLVSFQCHTAHHRDLSYMSADELRADFEESCGIIEEITGKPVRALAYPAGSYNDTVLSVADGYFDFAYTTKSPYSYPDYNDLTVPRYYIARGFGRNAFLNYLN